MLVPSEPIVQRIEDDSEMTPLEEAERQAMDSASDTLRMVIRVGIFRTATRASTHILPSLVCQLDITVGSTHLRDKFEYPVSQSSSKISPEVFARILCADLALQPEFIPSIAHSIREQLCLARIQWEDEMNAPEIGRSGFRIREEDWEPSIREITDSDLVKLAKDRDRNPRLVPGSISRRGNFF